MPAPQVLGKAPPPQGGRGGWGVVVVLGLLLLPCLVWAETFSVETDGRYRVYIGPDHQTDWVDVCCLTNKKFELEYADYTPIETIQIEQSTSTLRYTITKKHSRWVLSGSRGTTSDWTLRRVEP